jgi:hypothetical protein
MSFGGKNMNRGREKEKKEERAQLESKNDIVELIEYSYC